MIDEHALSEAWVQKINAIDRANTVESAVAIGQLLRAAKTALPPGAIDRLAAAGVFPFKVSMVYRLMRIAAHPLLVSHRFRDALPNV